MCLHYQLNFQVLITLVLLSTSTLGFTKTDIFTLTKDFSKTNYFSLSIYFTGSNEFSPSFVKHLTDSLIFSPSGTFIK